MAMREWESILNIRLAAVLRGLGLDARPEVIHPNHRRIDVQVQIGPALIPVEAEHGQAPAKRADAVRDAEARLTQGLARCAVAVCYPEGATEISLPDSELIWAVRDGSGSPPNWVEGSIERLAAVIRLAPAQLGNPDFTAAVLSGSLDSAGRRLNETQKRLLARALDLPPQTRNGRPVRNPWDAPAKRALLVVATAVMFHSRLDSHSNDLRPELDNRTNPQRPFTGDWPPPFAARCVESADPVGDFAAAWNLILALDYKPIFETGRAALLSCPRDPSFTDAIRDAAFAALAASGDIAGFRHDLLGRIFHTVLDTARYDGSFYTTTPAATLLATLAITENLCDWSDPAAIARLRITDPACGTGTLLMAAAERIRDINPRLRDDPALAAALIEQVLAGYDVNLTATHMAATTLGLLSPTTQFQKMKIWRTLLGVDGDGVAHLGSLEFLDQKPMLMPWPNGASQATQVNGDAAAAMAEPADIVLMNPPFTQHDLRHHQFSDAERAKLTARESELFANKPVHLSGNSGSFLVLADYMVKADSGTIASVLPLVMATNTSALETRRFLSSHHHIETLVTSHDQQRAYFSENTSISEMLLVCRRWPAEQGPKPPTRIVNLARNPSTPAEAVSVARAIQDGRADAQDYGTVQEWPENLIAAGNWSAVQFLSPYLSDRFAALGQSRLFPVAALSDQAEVGPHGVGTRMNFRRAKLADRYARVALWDHRADVIRSMAAATDSYIAAKAAKGPLADRLWSQRGRLMLPERIRFNTDRLTCVRLNERALGSAWMPCKPATEGDPESLEKALCVYLNSSWGLLTFLGIRSSRTLSYSYFSLDDLRRLPVPAFAAMGPEGIALLAAAYDEHSAAVMLPLPQLNACPARQALDAAVVAALGLDAEEVSTLRRELAREPSVTGQRYAGLGRQALPR